MHDFMRRAARAFGGCGGPESWSGWGHGSHHAREGHGDDPFEGGWGGGLGVRRPLRFLAHRLDLDERQVAELARILNELKTERAQAEVDRRRTVAAFADALGSEGFDPAKASEGGDLRVKSAERVRDAVLKALREIHGVLNPQQRTQLAYLIRTGTLVI
jgi:Spy/CpxP family protein refolding chaperone